MFLTQRKMKVVIDGDVSKEATVDSGVPQGTVLGPLLFLCHIHDLPDSVWSPASYDFMKSCSVTNSCVSHEYPDLNPWFNDVSTLCLSRCFSMCLQITEKLLKNINPSKASGPDNIPNRILKECAKQLAPGLKIIYQKSIDTAILPRDWLNANNVTYI
jgi:hypothetical protein